MLKSGGSIDSGEDEVVPLCWRCRRHVQALENHCPRCKHPLAYSLATHGKFDYYTSYYPQL